MPSVGSIFSVLKKRCLQGEPAKSQAASFPLIDPLDSFYLLNPGGDLSETQVEFESWFRDQNFEVTYNIEPALLAVNLFLDAKIFKLPSLRILSGESWIGTKCGRVDRSITKS